MAQRVDGEHARPVQPGPPPPAEPPERVVPLSTQPGLTEIRPEQVETAAKLFEDSAVKLTKLINDGRTNLQMQPMANDDVSKRAAEGFSKAGLDGPGSHVDALEQYREWLTQIAAGIRASAVQYTNTDVWSADGMRRVEGA